MFKEFDSSEGIGDRFAGAGLAGQNGKATVECEIKLVDQNDVADGQLNEHGVDGLPGAPPDGAALSCFAETGKSFNLSIEPISSPCCGLSSRRAETPQ